jgi:hypothetical protein
MIKKILSPKLLLISIFTSLAFALTISLVARDDGITGLTASTSNGCASCHGGSSSSSTTVSISSSSGTFSVAPNSTNDFTITVENSSQSASGINIAVKTTENGNTDVGSLSPATGSGLKKSGNELTHTSPKSFSNNTVDFDFSWTSPSDAGEYYIRSIANAVNGNGSSDANDSWNWMPAQKIIVKGIDITSPTAGSSYCKEDQLSINADIYGVENVNIYLKQSGSDFSESIASNLSTAQFPYNWNVITSLEGGEYYILVEDANDSNIKSESSNITIQGTPSITTQPQNTVVCEGSTLNLAVEVSGSGYDYQWKKDGNNISGKTLQNLSISGVSLDDAGTYTVEISNDCGESLLSSEANVSITPKPSITSQPQSKNICPQESFTLSITAEGEGLTYQWYKDSQMITNETSNSLTVNNASEDDEGDYYVIVSGDCDPSETSNIVNVMIKDEVVLNQQPDNISACEGDTVSIDIDVTGDDLSYTWFRNTIEIPDQTGKSIEFNGIIKDNEGSYYVEITDDCGNTVTTDFIQVAISESISILSQPQDKEALTGSSVSFSVEVEGTANNYQWFKDGEAIENSNTSSLNLNSLQLEDAGEYNCIITGDCNEVTTDIAVLTVNDSGENGPIISFDLSTLDFGEIPLGNEYEMSFENIISNKGNEELTITSISIDGSDKFSYSGDQIISILPNESANLSFIFNAGETEGDFTAILKVESNAINEVNVSLKGKAIIYKPVLSVDEYVLEEISESGQAFNGIEISNESDFDYEVESITIEGENSNNFVLNISNFPILIEAGSMLNVPFAFNFEESGTYTATMVIQPKYGDSFEIDIIANATINSINYITEIESSRIYPNPSSGLINIEVMLQKPIIADLKVFDQNGKIVKNIGEYSLLQGHNHFSWNIHSDNGEKVSSGIYYLMIKSKNNTQTIKININ